METSGYEALYTMSVWVAAFKSPAPLPYCGWTGIGQHTNATQMQRAVPSLYILTGTSQ